MMTEKNNERQSIRLDKWLWVAREMIMAGKVHYNHVQAKPSRIVEIGAEIRLKQGIEEKTIIVQAIAIQRLSAGLANELYQETPESQVKLQKLAESRKNNALFITFAKQKPNKKNTPSSDGY